MKTALAVVVVLVLCLMATGCYAQDSSRFQSVGGDFGRNVISTIKSDDTQPASASDNSSSLWSWGSSPKGTLVVDGNLIGDPRYTMKKLKLDQNWLGDSFVDPYGTIASAYSYVDAETGEPVKTYVDPITGQSYYTYVDYKTGKLVYVYFNPVTGEPTYASFTPLSGQYVEEKQFALPPIFSSNDPWS
ncbi:MAG: hypothetical protein JW999_05095 [Methanotrichaceae archaeon]|nr:hypothetical protein [Methanotrichaceae archaeon]